MKGERLQQVQKLCLAALEREESEQHQFLENACGQDEALRREVESLLAYQRDIEDFIESPALGLVAELVAHNRIRSDRSYVPDSDLTGETVTHYRVLERIGRGGMGVVYKAEDTKLRRLVALKFLSGVEACRDAEKTLPPHEWLYGSKALEGLEREARASSALDHPNICTVYEVDQHQGSPFIAMQFLTGLTLKDEIADKALPTDRILDLSVQIADALDAAHAGGIVHRDIKSANIFVTHRAEVKILDFGLAKLNASPPAAVQTAELPQEVPRQSSGDTLSGPGKALGTAAYMSPEQVLGKEVDARSDLFSFGVVLYEMATGTLPFKGETGRVVFDRILHDPPVAPSDVNSSLPKELARIVEKALEKSVELRYQTAGELRDDLERLKPGPTEEVRRRLTRLAVATVLLSVVCVAGYLHFWGRRPSGITEQDSVVLGDFSNTTGDTIFDGTLKNALRVQLEQSPFLNVVTEEKARSALSYMGRPRTTVLRGDVAKEVCLRTGGKAAVEGSISPLGSHYVVGLQAVNCQTGEAVGDEIAEAQSREKVLRALDDATTRLRTRLGESLASIQKYDTPVEATTASLDALQTYSVALEVLAAQGGNNAVPYLKRATELDPSFAMAYARLGTAYFNFNQPRMGSAATTRAYQLRERVSEREKLYIDSHYYTMVTGETDKSIEIYRLWQKTYPRDIIPYINLTSIYSNLGQYDKCVTEGLEALRLSANNALAYGNLGVAFINLNQFDQAAKILNEAAARKLDNASFPGIRYQLAFVQDNQDEMERQAATAVGKSGIESWLLALQGDTEAYHGRSANARKYTRGAAASARHDGDEETARAYAVVGALREAEFGNRRLAKEQARAMLAHDPDQQVLFLGALALARAGEHEEPLALVRLLNQHFPADTLLENYWLPTIRAAVELDRGSPSQAIETLEMTRRYELAAPQLSANVLLYPVYLRGSAYLAVGSADRAAAEFQKILNHPGLAGNYLLSALAHLGLGRSYALEAGVPIAHRSPAERKLSKMSERPEALAMARAAYQDFFAIWKDADHGIPLLVEAQTEYRKLR